MTNTTIGIKSKTKKAFKEFKNFVKSSLGDDDFLIYLMKTHPKRIEFIQEVRENAWLREFAEKNKIQSQVTWEEFKQNKIKEELK